MKIFLDTAVLIAASDTDHPHYLQSARVFSGATRQTAFCGAHTLAEAYSVLSRMPGSKRLAPEIAERLIAQITEKVTVIPLTVDEYAATISEMAERSLSGCIVFDGLLLACARKANAERIYTWNLKHFRRIAPDLADRIVTP